MNDIDVYNLRARMKKAKDDYIFTAFDVLGNAPAGIDEDSYSLGVQNTLELISSVTGIDFTNIA